MKKDVVIVSASISNKEIYKIFPGIDNRPEFLELMGDDGVNYKILLNSLSSRSGSGNGKEYTFTGNINEEEYNFTGNTIGFSGLVKGVLRLASKGDKGKFSLIEEDKERVFGRGL